MSFKRILSLMDQVRAERVLLLCHQNADPDALCAAFSMSKLLKKIRPKVEIEIASPQGVSKLSKILLDKLPMSIKEEKPRFEQADVIFMLDTNTIRQLGDWSEEIKAAKAPIVVIDHHASHPETEKMATICIFKESSSSTCEIILEFFKELGLKPSQLEAKALFLGIAFDTKHFILANSETFKAVADLVESGINPQKALSLLSLPMDLSERIARLKAGRRARLMRINNWIVVFSHVRSFQASAARALIDSGADVAIVVGQKGDEVRISLRASQEFYKKTNFHLGRDLARPLGEYLHGMGGGHSTSAGVDGIGDFTMVVKRSTRILKEKLKD
ncbi:MAG: bifunctional oligoribonuclease/PAP phosphatase NrnA [Candidatus Bathyarchaeia archaeon]